MAPTRKEIDNRPRPSLARHSLRSRLQQKLLDGSARTHAHVARSLGRACVHALTTPASGLSSGTHGRVKPFATIASSSCRRRESHLPGASPVAKWYGSQTPDGASSAARTHPSDQASVPRESGTTAKSRATRTCSGARQPGVPECESCAPTASRLACPKSHSLATSPSERADSSTFDGLRSRCTMGGDRVQVRHCSCNLHAEGAALAPLIPDQQISQSPCVGIVESEERRLARGACKAHHIDDVLMV